MTDRWLATGAALAARGAGVRVEAFDGRDLSPLTWLGDAAAEAVSDVWRAAMIGLWSAGLWLLRLAFTVIDALTTPDLSPGGPIGAVLPTTLWLGATVAGLVLVVQLGTVFIRRDGASLARLLLGVAQFGAVWIGYLGIGAGLVAAASALEKGLLSSLLGVGSLGGYDLASSWPRDVVDTTLATVLGVLSLLLVIPAAFAYLIIMFVREAALIVLVVTAPITAAGLLGETTRAWFWKSLRWFIACLLIAPTTALVLGIGVRLSAGVISGAGSDTPAAAGMAVVGTVMVAVGAVCPLVLFRLLAFVDPGTSSGAALRQSWAAAGGLGGVLSGRTGEPADAGFAAAARTGADGRSAGEAAAEARSAGRLLTLLGPVGGAVGAGLAAATTVATRAAAVGVDVLGAAGVGAPDYGPPWETGPRTGGPSSGSPGRRRTPPRNPSPGGAAPGSGEEGAP